MLTTVANHTSIVTCSIEDSPPAQLLKFTTVHHQDRSMTVRHKLGNRLALLQSMVQRRDQSCTTGESDYTFR